MLVPVSLGAGMELEVAFGQVLRELRKKRGLSQERLALEAGIDRTFVSLLERGLRQPTLRTMFTLGRTLGVKPDEIVARVQQLGPDGF